MPGNVAWRPGREQVQLVQRLIDEGHDDRRIVIKIGFNQLAWNKRARVTNTRYRRITIRALVVRTIHLGGCLVVLMLTMLTFIRRHHRCRRARTHQIDEHKRQGSQQM